MALFLLGVVPLALIWLGLDLWVSYRNSARTGRLLSEELGLWVAGSFLVTLAGYVGGVVIRGIRPWDGRFQVGPAFVLEIVPLLVASTWVLFVFAPSLITWVGIGVLDTLLLPELTTAAWLLVGLAVASGFDGPSAPNTRAR